MGIYKSAYTGEQIDEAVGLVGTKQDALSAQQLANIAAVPSKIGFSDLRAENVVCQMAGDWFDFDNVYDGIDRITRKIDELSLEVSKTSIFYTRLNETRDESHGGSVVFYGDVEFGDVPSVRGSVIALTDYVDAETTRAKGVEATKQPMLADDDKSYGQRVSNLEISVAKVQAKTNRISASDETYEIKDYNGKTFFKFTDDGLARFVEVLDRGGNAHIGIDALTGEVVSNTDFAISDGTGSTIRLSEVNSAISPLVEKVRRIADSGTANKFSVTDTNGKVFFEMYGDESGRLFTICNAEGNPLFTFNAESGVLSVTGDVCVGELTLKGLDESKADASAVKPLTDNIKLYEVDCDLADLKVGYLLEMRGLSTTYTTLVAAITKWTDNSLRDAKFIAQSVIYGKTEYIIIQHDNVEVHANLQSQLDYKVYAIRSKLHFSSPNIDILQNFADDNSPKLGCLSEHIIQDNVALNDLKSGDVVTFTYWGNVAFSPLASYLVNWGCYSSFADARNALLNGAPLTVTIARKSSVEVPEILQTYVTYTTQRKVERIDYIQSSVPLYAENIPSVIPVLFELTDNYKELYDYAVSWAHSKDDYKTAHPLYVNYKGDGYGLLNFVSETANDVNFIGYTLKDSQLSLTTLKINTRYQAEFNRKNCIFDTDIVTDDEIDALFPELISDFSYDFSDDFGAEVE